MNALVRATYAAYAGRRLCIPRSRRGIPETRRRSTVTITGETIVHHAPVPSTQTRKRPHHMITSPK
jgi:hypothetical protein